jgi:intracellular multiplication protein IcmO
MIQRKIVGPQDQYERTGAQSLRDIRPLSIRLGEVFQSSASGIVLGMAAVGTYLEPAAVNVALPAAVAYATWVLTRKVRLPGVGAL